jgi:hypothetical protein
MTLVAPSRDTRYSLIVLPTPVEKARSRAKNLFSPIAMLYSIRTAEISTALQISNAAVCMLVQVLAAAAITLLAMVRQTSTLTIAAKLHKMQHLQLYEAISSKAASRHRRIWNWCYYIDKLAQRLASVSIKL